MTKKDFTATYLPMQQTFNYKTTVFLKQPFARMIFFKTYMIPLQTFKNIYESLKHRITLESSSRNFLLAIKRY